MTDNNLYEHIRRLVKQQKERLALNSQHNNFAEEYCNKEMLKKKQVKDKNRRVSNLFKNFKKVQSYINIMDIISNLPLNLNRTSTDLPEVDQTQQLPEILTKTLKTRIKQELSPILNKRYEQQQAKRQELISDLKDRLSYSNEELLQDTNFRQLFKSLNDNRLSDKLDLIDILRKDIKRKETYFLQRKFDRQMQDLSIEPKKVQNTKLFHKICSYLHMILEQEHKQKWASKQDKQLRETYRHEDVRQKFKIPTFVRKTTQSTSKQNLNTSFHNIRFGSTCKQGVKFNDQPHLNSTMHSSSKLPNGKQNHASFDEPICKQFVLNDRNMMCASQNNCQRLKSQKQILKQTFTFRKRGIKAKLMSRINDFAQKMTAEQRKNLQTSKKYGRALNSLAEQIQYSYGQYEQQQIAEEQDINEMKRYLDNTLSRNKRNLKKFHHR